MGGTNVPFCQRCEGSACPVGDNCNTKVRLIYATKHYGQRTSACLHCMKRSGLTFLAAFAKSHEIDVFLTSSSTLILAFITNSKIQGQ